MPTPPDAIAFAGIDRRDDTSLPNWYRAVADARRDQAATFPSFNEATRQLPKAETQPAGYRDPTSDEWVEDPEYVAVVNPAWLADRRDPTDPDTAVWQFATDSYTVVNPLDMYGPLAATLRRFRGDDDKPDLGDVYGQARLYRLGGEVHLDLVFDGLRVGDPDGADTPFVLGIQTGYDHLGGRKLYAEAIAYDTRTGTQMRALSEKRTRRHVGTAKQTVADWWESVLEMLATAAETLFEVVVEARNYVVEFADYPFDAQEFYEFLDYPDYLAEQAADRLGTGVRRADAWLLYHAMATTLTKDFDGKDGGDALTGYVRTANDILFTPPRAEAAAVRAKETDLRGQGTLDPETADAAEALAAKRETAEESVGAFTTTRARLRTLLTEAEGSA